jgi:SagB-type dehydrogenase family enzyme
MLEEIKRFYELIRIRKIEQNNQDNEVPITFTHVFKKAYPRLSSIQLPRINSKSRLEEILKSRESIRDFSNEQMTLKELTKILNSCRIVDKRRYPERRTYPSAGARFPIEIYILNYKISGLDKGAYHYNIDQMSLEVLWEKDLSSKQIEIMGPSIKNPAATIVLTSVISRSEVKYWYKALPFSYLEAGHIGQNIILSATENKIAACPVSGFVDDTIKEILDITYGEIPVYTINIGKKKVL